MNYTVKHFVFQTDRCSVYTGILFIQGSVKTGSTIFYSCTILISPMTHMKIRMCGTNHERLKYNYSNPPPLMRPLPPKTSPLIRPDF